MRETRLPARDKDKAVLSAQRVGSYIVLILITFACLFSFYILIVNATRSHPDIQKGFSAIFGGSFFYNLNNLLSNENLPVLYGIRNSLIISGAVAALSTYFSALTAYAIHAYNFRFKNVIFAFILLVMMVPNQVSALGFIQLMDNFNMMDSFWPLILPQIAAPVVFYFMLQYMRSVLPVEIVEAARIDGSGEFYTFNRVVIPILKPALAVQGIFQFVLTWNNYFIPQLILESPENKTLPILIAQLRSADFLRFDMGQVYMLIAISIVPIIIVYVLLSRFIIRGITLGSVKG